MIGRKISIYQHYEWGSMPLELPDHTSSDLGSKPPVAPAYVGMTSPQGAPVRFTLVLCLITLVCASPINAAAPTKSPKAPPLSLNIRTAGELADACTVTPTTQASFASLNFCNGFAQGVLQTYRQNPSGTKICIPSPSPKRSETMKEFASWVRAEPSRKDELASVAFLRFMAGRFPCT